MRIAIFGNSGSGKSTLARALRDAHALPLLELDSIVWEPDQIAVLRERGAILRDLGRFVEENSRWVIEGCYGELIGAVLPHKPEVIFMNPGEEVCLKNNLARPWEPDKYSSKEEQDKMLDGLLAWVREYYTRDGDLSLAGHKALFERYDGPKREIRELADAAVLRPTA